MNQGVSAKFAAEQAAGPVRRRDDGVHLVVPEAAAPLRARGPVVEREAPRNLAFPI